MLMCRVLLMCASFVVCFSHSDRLRSAPLEWNAIRKIIQSLCFFSGAERFDDFETSPAGKTETFLSRVICTSLVVLSVWDLHSESNAALRHCLMLLHSRDFVAISEHNPDLPVRGGCHGKS